MSEVDLRVEGGIATITMNRPDRLNAMNPAMREQLVAVFDETVRKGTDPVRTHAGRLSVASELTPEQGLTFSSTAQS